MKCCFIICSDSRPTSPSPFLDRLFTDFKESRNGSQHAQVGVSFIVMCSGRSRTVRPERSAVSQQLRSGFAADAGSTSHEKMRQLTSVKGQRHVLSIMAGKTRIEGRAKLRFQHRSDQESLGRRTTRWACDQLTNSLRELYQFRIGIFGKSPWDPAVARRRCGATRFHKARRGTFTDGRGPFRKSRCPFRKP